MRHVAEPYTRKDGKVVDGRVSRRVTAPRTGELVVTIAPEGIYLREAGRRTAYLLPHGVAFQRAAALYAAAERAKKDAARKARRAAR